MNERTCISAAPSRGTETILLVEDEEGVRELASRVLKRLGYTILKASHPGEALRLSQEHQGPIHLLLTDIVMPKMNGYELAAKLVSSRPDTKVLYISGYADSCLQQQALQSRASLLQKPFTPAALANKLREVLDAQA